jgi:hypothetical protein
MIRRWWRLAVAWWLWRMMLIGAMTDANRVTAILNAIMVTGSDAPTWPAAWYLRLMTAMGSNTANGTEATSGNCPGYSPGSVAGNSMGAWTAISGTTANITGPASAHSWTATANWTPIAGIEIWDGAGTPLRWFQGALSGGSVTINNGNTLQFAPNSIGLNGTGW